MTRYEELCEAHRAWAPRQLAIDAIFRELPQKLKQALSDHLEVPATPARLPSQMAGHAIAYVELYRPCGPNGTRTWEVCSISDYLRVDSEGICHFTIGICVEPLTPDTSFVPVMHYVDFTIESVDEQLAELQFAKTGHKIPIDFRTPAGYPDAAARVITHLLEGLKDTSASRGIRRSPIGFEHFGGRE
jgi:hypothetical protein